MNGSPLVAIVIPAYITSRGMRGRVEVLTQKIYDQTKSHSAGLWVVDDGSPVPFYTPGELVRLPENFGVAAARNFGIEVSDSRYIAFVDADDDVPDDFVARCENFAAQAQADIYQFKARHGDGNIGYPTPCAWGKLISREWIGADRFDPLQLIGEEDTLFLKKPATVVCVDSVNYYHCPDANPDSLMKRFWRGEIPRRKGGNDYANR